MTPLPKRIEEIVKRIEGKGYKLVSDVQTVLTDETRNNFIATLIKDGKRFFFKTRLSPKLKFKIRIRREITFYTLLKNKGYGLYQFIPSFIEGMIGEVDYYITEYCEGKNLGSRTKLDENSLQLEQLSIVGKILKSMASIDTAALKGNQYFERRTSSYHQNYFNKRVKVYAQYLEPELVDRVQNFVFSGKFNLWLDQSANTISHGDFQAPNLIDTGKTIKIVDWDNVGLDNPLFDPVYFWVHSWRRPKIRKAFIKKHLRPEDREHFLRLAVYLLFIQVAALRDFLKNPPDYAEKEEIHRRQQGHDIHLGTIEKVLAGKSVL